MNYIDEPFEIFPSGDVTGKRRIVITKRIGEGGEGIVYDAMLEHGTESVPIVLKKLKQTRTYTRKLINNTIKELLMLSHLNHCNGIVKIIGIVLPESEYIGNKQRDNLYIHKKEDLSVYIMYNKLEGHTLLDYVYNSYRTDRYDVKKLLHSIVTSVKCMHAKTIVHRDLKPENIMTDGTNTYIIDYGAACPAASCGFESSGFTPAYSPFEQFNEPTIPRRIMVEEKKALFLKYDIFSIGCIVYFMLTKHILYPNMLGSYGHNKNTIPFSHIPKDHVQYGWVNLLEDTLNEDPRERISADTILNRIDRLPDPDFAMLTNTAGANAPSGGMRKRTYTARITRRQKKRGTRRA